jgi:hypothetical protein
MAEQEYTVIREHIGDKPYAVGDVRTADPKEVEHLIGKVLEPVERPAKKAKKPTPAPAAETPKKPASKRKGKK